MSNATDKAYLEDMGRPELIRLANQHYGIAVTKEMTKDDLIQAIKNKENRSEYAKLAKGERPAPGWARVMLHRNPAGNNRPAYFAINGFRITIPRGVEVDIPIKFVGVLQDAVEKVLREDLSKPVNSPDRYVWEEAPSYPFIVLDRTEGPDPRPGSERAKLHKYKIREAFRDAYGYWPRTSDEIRDFVKSGKYAELTKE